jgi:hypothetical protein
MKSYAQACIEHEVAELRGTYPRLTACHTALRNWFEGGEARYSLWLDLRWAQHQSIVSGPACPGAEQAVAAAFGKARQILDSVDA